MKDVEAWLGKVKKLDNKTKCLMEQIVQNRLLSQKVATSLGGGLGSDRSVDKIGNIVSQIVDDEKDLERLVTEILELKKAVRSVIEQLENSTYKTLLYSRYILLKPWDKVACDVNYSVAHTRGVLKQNALKDICRVFLQINNLS